jgi:hypothetical protein
VTGARRSGLEQLLPRGECAFSEDLATITRGASVASIDDTASSLGATHARAAVR